MDLWASIFSERFVYFELRDKANGFEELGWSSGGTSPCVELGDFEPAKELLAKPVASTGREGRLREKLTKRLKATAPG